MFAYVKPKSKETSKNTIQKKEPEQPVAKPNLTGIPDGIKTQFENMSGFSFDDVRVHYNSDNPAQLQALAYTQGNQVYIGQGQERHLSHELGHVVQQKQSHVKPTISFGNILVNNDSALEQEADTMLKSHNAIGSSNVSGNISTVIQARWKYTTEARILMWDALVNNCQWYYNEETTNMYYENMETKEVSEKKSYADWCASYGGVLENPLRDESNSIKSREDGTGGRAGRAGLGLELELSLSSAISVDLADLRHKLTKNEGEPVDEKYIKANTLFTLVDGKVKVTYDTRTSYDTEASGANVSLTPELIFDDSKISTTSDLKALGEALINEIKAIDSSRIVGEHDFQSKTGPNPKLKVSSFRSLEKYPFSDATSMGIHITAAIPLKELWSLINSSANKNPFYVSIDTRITDNYEGLTDEVKTFLYLMETMFKGSDADFEKPTDDPKRNMKFMNRTSFGKMFTMLYEAEQQSVIDQLKSLETYYKKPLVSSEKDLTFAKMIQYLEALMPASLKTASKEDVEKTVNNDPTYKLSKKENTGISGLGGTTEIVSGEEAPIFEFRSVSGQKLSELPALLERIYAQLNSK